MDKLDLEKAEELDIKLRTFVGSQGKEGNSRKTSTSSSLTVLKLLTVWITATVDNSERDGNTRALTCLLRNLYAGQKVTVRTGHGTMDWFNIGKEIH